MSIHIINPLFDGRWNELVSHHARASVFHEPGWLEALARTYGYEPFVLTSTPACEPLQNGLVLCRVASWITGTRLVSLPFADHCEPLLRDTNDCEEFATWLRTECDRQQWRYVELRPLSWNENSDAAFRRGRSYCFHTLDLTPTLEQIFRGLHKDSLQRRIRRAERERLSYDTGRGERLVDEFYDLVRMTRRRHRLVPQPRSWFRNLVECVDNNLQIRLARKNGVAIAAIMTLKHRSSVVYKYGCSDERYHNLAGMPFLFWKLIEESKAADAVEIDFGRSDLDNKGLIAFKDRFGTRKKLLTYLRYSRTGKKDMACSWGSRAIRQIVSLLPENVLPTAARIMYRHIG